MGHKFMRAVRRHVWMLLLAISALASATLLNQAAMVAAGFGSFFVFVYSVAKTLRDG